MGDIFVFLTFAVVYRVINQLRNAFAFTSKRLLWYTANAGLFTVIDGQETVEVSTLDLNVYEICIGSKTLDCGSTFHP